VGEVCCEETKITFSLIFVKFITDGTNKNKTARQQQNKFGNLDDFNINQNKSCFLNTNILLHCTDSRTK